MAGKKKSGEGEFFYAAFPFNLKLVRGIFFSLFVFLFDMFTISMNLFANNKRMIFRTEGLEFPWCKGAAKVSLPQGLFFQLIHLLKMVTTKK